MFDILKYKVRIQQGGEYDDKGKETDWISCRIIDCLRHLQNLLSDTHDRVVLSVSEWGNAENLFDLCQAVILLYSRISADICACQKSLS